MKVVLSTALLLSASTLAAPPRIDDYAMGMTVDVGADRPVVEILLPDEIYQNIVQPDLSDVRVFNHEGTPVLHAVCAAEATLAPLVSRESLSVFEVETTPQNADAAEVDVQTTGGTRVEINEATSEGNGNAQASSHVIDARAVAGEIRAIELDWSSADGASEARVQIQASDDLDTWRTVVSQSTLLKVIAGTQELRRQIVPLAQQRYAYLRVRRVDGPTLRIDGARAEVVAAPVSIEPVWFAADGVPGTTQRSLSFNATRLAPISFARLSLPQTNSSVRVAIRSRDDAKAPWQTQWSGEIYNIVANGERRVSAPPQFKATHDRYWQIEPLNEGDPFYDNATLELGYRPARLRFLAQGSGPFTLAYGSRRAEPAIAQSCDRLLTDVNSADMADLVVQAAALAPHSLGGAIALKPLPRQTPLRQMALWGILIAGVGLLTAMAWSLFRRLRLPAE